MTQRSVPEEPEEITLNVPRGGIIMTLDPAESYSIPTHEVLTPVYETLLRYDPDDPSQLVPTLATDWEVSSDGLTYTLTLREGVTYTDGTPFNASCVIFSFNRTLSLGMGPSWVLSALNISECRAVDTQTVELVLKYPYSPFINALAAQWGPLIVSPSFVETHSTPDDPWAHEYLKENMCGTGPYMLEEWEPEDHVTLVKNPDYWGGWEGDHVDKVYMPIIEESTTRRLRLEEGSIDLGGLNIEDSIEVNGTEGINVKTVPSLNNLQIFLNTKKPPLDNKLVRQAISYMFDYEGAVNTIRQGFGNQARGPLPRTLWGWNPECPQYNLDLDRAVTLLDEAGFSPEEIELDVWYLSSSDEERRCAELLQSKAASIGVTITPKAVTWSAMMDALRPGSNDPRDAADMSIFYWYPDYADPDDYLSNMYYCYNEETPYDVNSYAFFNWAFYNNPELNNLLDEATRVTDFEKRVELYHKAQNMIVEDAPAIFLFDEPEILTYRNWVKGYYFNPCYVGCIDFYSIYIEGR
ncbi:MAG: ABC transporter substrate-binding protein [Candidatus Bathyarchaeia archaeon]